MPTFAKRKLLLPALVLVALLALPSGASATLSYVTVPRIEGRASSVHVTPPVVFIAADNGSNPQRIQPGTNPHVSPDGRTVAYLHEGGGHAQELKLASVEGGPIRTLMAGWREPFYLAWSPDSSKLAALRGPELGKRKLVVIDVATGAQKVVARGFFSGFSFSPDGSELVFSRAGSERYPPRSDVFRVSAGGGKPVALTHDHRSLDPLWGPANRIVLVKQLGAKRRRYGPKNELYLMNPRGKRVRRLTHTRVDPLLQGLYPTDWSADGTRLLAEFEGQDTSYAVTVNPKTGAQGRVGVKPAEHCPQFARCRARTLFPIVGTALSADGKTILGYTGGFEPGPNHAVVAVPFPSGRPRLFVNNAFEPDWSL
jgi:dipeptidyl aminopeptidase/acylaminoacyl peptidase